MEQTHFCVHAILPLDTAGSGLVVCPVSLQPIQEMMALLKATYPYMVRSKERVSWKCPWGPRTLVPRNTRALGPQGHFQQTSVLLEFPGYYSFAVTNLSVLRFVDPMKIVWQVKWWFCYYKYVKTDCRICCLTALRSMQYLDQRTLVMGCLPMALRPNGFAWVFFTNVVP
eukprot:jgi/Botrbrau1/7334/Bobra.247_3s0029.1